MSDYNINRQPPPSYESLQQKPLQQKNDEETKLIDESNQYTSYTDNPITPTKNKTTHTDSLHSVNVKINEQKSETEKKLLNLIAKDINDTNKKHQQAINDSKKSTLLRFWDAIKFKLLAVVIGALISAVAFAIAALSSQIAGYVFIIGALVIIVSVVLLAYDGYQSLWNPLKSFYADINKKLSCEKNNSFTQNNFESNYINSILNKLSQQNIDDNDSVWSLVPSVKNYINEKKHENTLPEMHKLNQESINNAIHSLQQRESTKAANNKINGQDVAEVSCWCFLSCIFSFMRVA